MKQLVGRGDAILWLFAGIATIIGAVMIFDAGYARSIQDGYGPIPREFKSQSLYIVFSLIAYALCTKIPLERWGRWSTGLFLLSLAALVAVELVGKELNGAKRWLELGPLMIQPAEFFKCTSILFLALSFAKRQRKKPIGNIAHWGLWMDKVFVPFALRALPVMLVLLGIFLINKEPDLGTAAIVAVTLFAMMILGGVSRRSLLLFSIGGSIAVTVMVLQEPYRVDRIVNHSQRRDVANRDDTGFQTITSETAIASGGWSGVGIGSGRAKHLMPAATTDFLMATVAEEFGLFGSLGVIGVLAAIVGRLVQLGNRHSSVFGQLVLYGVACWIGVQTCTNIMMANGTLPAIGIPLPFLSSGGSSLLALWIAVGICQSAVIAKAPQEETVEARGDGRWDRRSRLSRA